MQYRHDEKRDVSAAVKYAWAASGKGTGTGVPIL